MAGVEREKNGFQIKGIFSFHYFLNLIKKYELDEYWMKTNLMCIGEKTSSVLNELKWKKIFLFNPGEEEFLLYKI